MNLQKHPTPGRTWPNTWTEGYMQQADMLTMASCTTAPFHVESGLAERLAATHPPKCIFATTSTLQKLLTASPLYNLVHKCSLRICFPSWRVLGRLAAYQGRPFGEVTATCFRLWHDLETGANRQQPSFQVPVRYLVHIPTSWPPPVKVRQLRSFKRVALWAQDCCWFVGGLRLGWGPPMVVVVSNISRQDSAITNMVQVPKSKDSAASSHPRLRSNNSHPDRKHHSGRIHASRTFQTGQWTQPVRSALGS